MKIHSAKEYDKADLITKYVNHMYQIKKNSVGPQRRISKLLLNSLYGLFGRKQDVIETLTINRLDLPLYTATNIIKTIIPVSEDKYTILMIKNVNFNTIKELNVQLNINIS